MDTKVTRERKRGRRNSRRRGRKGREEEEEESEQIPVFSNPKKTKKFVNFSLLLDIFMAYFWFSLFGWFLIYRKKEKEERRRERKKNEVEKSRRGLKLKFIIPLFHWISFWEKNKKRGKRKEKERMREKRKEKEGIRKRKSV